MKRAPLLCLPLLALSTVGAQSPSPQAPTPPAAPAAASPAPVAGPVPTPATPTAPSAAVPVSPAGASVAPNTPTAPTASPVPQPAQPGATTPPAPQGDPLASAAGALFDNRLPMLDPSGGLIRFNGQNWNISDNAVFRGRFEKYLSVPEESGKDESEHREILNKIIALLDPNNLRAQTMTDAYKLLARAATYPGDSRLCDTLANAIYSVWAVKRNQQRLDEANRILEDENSRLRRNMVHRAAEEDLQRKPEQKAGKGGTNNNLAVNGGNQLGAPQPVPQPATPPTTTSGTAATTPTTPSTSTTASPTSGAMSSSTPSININSTTVAAPQGAQGAAPGQAAAPSGEAAGGTNPQTPNYAGMSAKGIAIAGYAEKMVENSARLKANSLKGDLSELQAKMEYQALLVQLFLQRRFHHVVIGSRFYRALFGDGDSRLNLPDSAQGPFKGAGGVPPTVATLESLSNEAMREVQTGIQAFHKLLDLGELRSASERLRDALLVGEFLPEMRTLPFERKRKVLRFVQKANALVSALEVRDFTLANELLSGPNGLRTIAQDFDASKPAALIETARNAARLHIAKARNSAISGDKASFEAALKEAAAIWPNNPELNEVASKAFAQGDQMAQTLLEFDQLVAQKNLRRIAEDPGRFLASMQTAPAEKQAQLKKIIEDFKSIEGSLMAAKEMDRQGNSAGAWETVDRVAKNFPDDLQLNQARALYTTKAADFVRSVQTAQEHEKRADLATSLAWFLKAQRVYPKSDTAEEAVQRLKSQILPQAQ